MDSGNPHPTPNRDDPYHGSVTLLDKDSKRVTSAHAYLRVCQILQGGGIQTREASPDAWSADYRARGRRDWEVWFEV